MLKGTKRLLAAWLAVALLYCWGLDRIGLIGPDEPRYAAIGRTMAASGDWITPKLWGEAWFEKPAFLYWLTGLGYRLGLGLETAARLPVAILSTAFLGAWFLLLEGEFGRKVAGAATILLGSSAGWVAYSELSLTDLPMAVFFSLALILVLRWGRTGELWPVIAGGAAAGLAVVSKGLVPLVLLVPCLSLFWGKRWGALWALSAFSIAALPWYVACWLRNGTPFLHEFFWRHHFERFANGSLLHQQPFWYYVPVLLAAIFPWSALAALIRPDWSDKRQTVLAMTVIFGFLFFSAAQNKLPGYLLPLLPSFCLLIALPVSESISSWVAVGTAAFLGLIPFFIRVLPGALEFGLTRSKPDWLWLLLAIPSAFVGWAISRTPRGTLLFGGLAMGIGLLSFKVWVLPEVDHRLSGRVDWASASPGAVCMDGGSRAWRYSVYFYADRKLEDCSSGSGRRGILRKK